MTKNNLTSAPESARRHWRLVLAHIVIAGTVVAATAAVVIREFFVPGTVAELSTSHVLMLLIGWQAVSFSVFTYLPLASRHSLPVGTAIEVAVLVVIGAVLPVVAVLLLLPGVWVVLVGAVVVTVGIGVRQLFLWRSSFSG